jgi:hypothetical protein
MKRNNVGITITFLIVVGLCSILIYNYSKSLDYNPYSYPKNGLADFYPDKIGYYKINPDTILVSLDRGKTDVFVQEFAIPIAPLLETSVSWSQSDYLKITNAVFQSAWKETFDHWNLLSMIFQSACQDNPNGFETSDIHFFKPVEETSDYTTREVLINPKYGLVSFGGGVDFPYQRSGWKSINLNSLLITADKALKIAEENGGEHFRLAAQNECSISLILNLEADDNWNVEYQKNDGLSNWKIQINPFTDRE